MALWGNRGFRDTRIYFTIKKKNYTNTNYWCDGNMHETKNINSKNMLYKCSKKNFAGSENYILLKITFCMLV